MKILYKWVITTKPLRIKKEIIKNVKEKRDGSIMDKGDYCTYGFKENLGNIKSIPHIITLLRLIGFNI